VPTRSRLGVADAVALQQLVDEMRTCARRGTDRRRTRSYCQSRIGIRIERPGCRGVAAMARGKRGPARPALDDANAEAVEAFMSIDSI